MNMLKSSSISPYLLFILALPVAALAQIGPTPGSTPIKPTFDRSDLVCMCLVKSLTVTSEQAQEDENSSRGRGVLQKIRANVEILDAFKSDKQQVGLVAIEYDQDVRQPVLGQGEKALLFLKSEQAATYTFADTYLRATPFTSLPHAASERGLAGLRSTLVAIAQQSNRVDGLRALELLEGFDSLDQDSVAAVSQLTASADPNIAFTALGVLLGTKSPESVTKLAEYLNQYKGDARPVALVTIGTKLGQIRDERARGPLEELSGSKYANIQFGAMTALRGIRDPKSAPVLIQRLDDPNSLARYLAVITLAEIFDKKNADYAPSMPVFEQDRGKYVEAWKKWWADEGHNLVPPDNSHSGQ